MQTFINRCIKAIQNVLTSGSQDKLGSVARTYQEPITHHIAGQREAEMEWPHTENPGRKHHWRALGRIPQGRRKVGRPKKTWQRY